MSKSWQTSDKGQPKHPPHPGAILRNEIFPSLNISQREIADKLGISPATLSEIVNEKRPITINTAEKVARFLGTSPEPWIEMQSNYDKWSKEYNKQKEGERYEFGDWLRQ